MKKCKEGHYYCYQDSKCKPIPKGFVEELVGIFVESVKTKRRILKRMVMVMANLTEVLTEMGTVGMVVEMVTVSLVVMVVVMGLGE